MTTMLLFVAATVGFTNFLVHSKVLDLLGIRPFVRCLLPEGWRVGLECYECMGFWSGLVMGIVVVSYHPAVFLPCAFAGSFLSQMFRDLANWLVSHTEFVIETDNGQTSE